MLQLGGVVVGGLLAGCLADDTPGGRGSGAGDEEGNDDDDADFDTVAYADLPEYEQRFVDEALERHSLDWISEDGQRTYLRSTPDGWEAVENPLIPQELGEDLRDVIAREKYLEIDSTYVEFWIDVGHGPYGARYRAVETDGCASSTIALEELPKPEQEIAALFIDEGELLLAEPRFEAVSDADVFVEIDAELVLRDEVLRGDGCLEAAGARYGAEIANEFILSGEGYDLARVNPDEVG